MKSFVDQIVDLIQTDQLEAALELLNKEINQGNADAMLKKLSELIGDSANSVQVRVNSAILLKEIVQFQTWLIAQQALSNAAVYSEAVLTARLVDVVERLLFAQIVSDEQALAIYEEVSSRYSDIEVRISLIKLLATMTNERSVSILENCVISQETKIVDAAIDALYLHRGEAALQSLKRFAHSEACLLAAKANKLYAQRKASQAVAAAEQIAKTGEMIPLQIIKELFLFQQFSVLWRFGKNNKLAIDDELKNFIKHTHHDEELSKSQRKLLQQLRSMIDI